MKVSTPSAIIVAVLVTDFHSALSVLSPTPLLPPNLPYPTPFLLFLLIFPCFPQIWSLDAYPLRKKNSSSTSSSSLPSASLPPPSVHPPPSNRFVILSHAALEPLLAPSFSSVPSVSLSTPALHPVSSCPSSSPLPSPLSVFPPVSFASSPCAPSSPPSVSSFSFAPISSPSSSFVPPPISSPLPSPPAFIFSTSISFSPYHSLSPAAPILPVSPKRGLLPPPSSLPVSLSIKGSDCHVSKRQTCSSTQASGVKLSSQIPPRATRSSSSKMSALPSSESPIQPSSK